MEITSDVFAIASGKGGVGKSVIAVNLAEVFAGRPGKVGLIDADMGQGGAGVLLDESPEHTVADAIQGGAPLRRTFHPAAKETVLVQAASEPVRSESAREEIYSALDTAVRKLRSSCDHVLIDAPAGTGRSVQWALDRADLGALVVVGEPTAVADAYRLAKMVWTDDPSYPMGLVVNYAEGPDDARSVAERFRSVTEQFLGQSPQTLGWVPFSRAMRRSVRKQTPAARDEESLRDAFVSMADNLSQRRHVGAPAAP